MDSRKTDKLNQPVYFKDVCLLLGVGESTYSVLACSSLNRFEAFKDFSYSTNNFKKQVLLIQNLDRNRVRMQQLLSISDMTFHSRKTEKNAN